MKTFVSILVLSVLLVAISASSPPQTRASDDWVGDVLSCTGNYIQSRETTWDNWNNSSQGPQDEWNFDNGLTAAFDTYQGCNSVVNIPYQAIDFCPAAYQAHMNCANQFQGLDATAARMECYATAGYDGHCV